MQAALEDVMGPDRMKDLKLRVHPLFKRWTLFERVRDPKGAERAWRPISIFQEPARPGHLPQDLRGDKYAAHVEGVIGDYRLPHKRDFEIIEKADVKKYGNVAVENELAVPEQAAERAVDSHFDSFTDDFLDYNFWLAMREANEKAGMYGKQWSTRTVEPRTNPKRWKMEQKVGYAVRTRVWGEEGDLNAIKQEVDAALGEGRSRIDIEEVDEINDHLTRLRRGRVTRTYHPDGRITEKAEVAPEVETTAKADTEQAKRLQLVRRRTAQGQM